MEAKEFTGYYDEKNEPIYVGDILECLDGYCVKVMKDGHGDYSGKLICEPGHSCENIPYHLCCGKNHIKIR